MLQEPELIDQLRRWYVYQDFERAFHEVTGWPLRLSHPEDRKLAGNDHANGLELPYTAEIPIPLGDKIIGVLQLGQPAREVRTAEHFKGSEKPQVATLSAQSDMTAKAYIGSTTLPRSRYQAMLRLLGLFVNQLSFFANEILIEQAEREPYRVRLAGAYIASRQTEDFSLCDVARAIHVSPFYLCKIFKRATGLTFVEFRNRLRIESAVKLLVNPRRSVSEIAYSVGFQSLSQFNRLFRRIVGQSPTAYRRSLTRATKPQRRNGIELQTKRDYSSYFCPPARAPGLQLLPSISAQGSRKHATT
jgi:AraC-like DNA-binding protein